MKLNCDVGEGMATDKEIIPFINQANIACGLHAGDINLMSETIGIAKQNGVQIGAHPSYDDRENFGRLPVSLTPLEIKYLVSNQVSALQNLAILQHCNVGYVKPHGALYNQMMIDDVVFSAIVEALGALTFPLKLMILARPDLQKYQKIADKNGVPLIMEAFADRAYDDRGYLVSRSQKGALLATTEQIEGQVRQLVEESTITTLNGNRFTLEVDSICVHGDNPLAVKQVQSLAKLIR